MFVPASHLPAARLRRRLMLMAGVLVTMVTVSAAPAGAETAIPSPEATVPATVEASTPTGAEATAPATVEASTPTTVEATAATTVEATGPGAPEATAPAAATPEGPAPATAEAASPAGEAVAPVPSEAAVAAQPVPLISAPARAAVCEGQTFTRAFSGLGDLHLYTPVPDAKFNGSSEGWELSGGAQIVESTRPGGKYGRTLDLPRGSVAVTPPICVTLLYPTARTWVQNPVGGAGVGVYASYAGTATATKPRYVAQLQASAGNWTSPLPFRVHPRLGGLEEGARELRLVFVGGNNSTDAHVWGVYVDPRMR